MKEFYRHVAPKEIIRQDMSILKSYDKLDTTPEVERMLFIQSLEGRAHNGAGAFNKRTYVNTTIDDVVRALDEKPEEVKAVRQKLVDDITAFVDDTLNARKRDRLTNADGQPFLGIPMFRDRKVNARDVLRGI